MSARLDDKDNRIPVRAVITVTEPSKLSSEPFSATLILSYKEYLDNDPLIGVTAILNRLSGAARDQPPPVRTRRGAGAKRREDTE